MALGKMNASLQYLQVSELVKTETKPMILNVLTSSIPCVAGFFGVCINSHPA